MSKRIKELLPAPVNLNPLAGHPTLGYTQLQMEEFAELIVRECAGIYSKIDNGNAHLGTEDYLFALHRHFEDE